MTSVPPDLVALPAVGSLSREGFTIRN
jgi:hypothetical protein